MLVLTSSPQYFRYVAVICQKARYKYHYFALVRPSGILNGLTDLISCAGEEATRFSHCNHADCVVGSAGISERYITISKGYQMI